MLPFNMHSKRVFGVVSTEALGTLVGRLNMLGFDMVLHILPGFTVVVAHIALVPRWPGSTAPGQPTLGLQQKNKLLCS